MVHFQIPLPGLARDFNCMARIPSGQADPEFFRSVGNPAEDIIFNHFWHKSLKGPGTAPDPEGMAKFIERFPIVAPLIGDKGNEFKAVMQKRYPLIETIVLELGEGIQVETS